MGRSRTERKDVHLLDLAIFMASSARDAIKFKQYEPIRILRSLTKVLELPDHLNCIEKDGFLEGIREELVYTLENSRPLKNKERTLTTFLDKAIIKMIREHKRRLGVRDLNENSARA